MAVPKRRTSKSKRNKRRANWKLTAPNLATCTKCAEYVMPHHACKACGTYDERVVLDVE